jgi:hypothetical protein
MSEISVPTFTFAIHDGGRTAHIMAGEYQASCIRVNPPQLFRQYQRWYLRADFAIHGDGAIISKYFNLDREVYTENGKRLTRPVASLSTRSDLFKACAMVLKLSAADRLDPAILVDPQLTFAVLVADKTGDGGTYSVVDKVLSVSQYSATQD